MYEGQPTPLATTGKSGSLLFWPCTGPMARDAPRSNTEAHPRSATRGATLPHERLRVARRGIKRPCDLKPLAVAWCYSWGCWRRSSSKGSGSRRGACYAHLQAATDGAGTDGERAEDWAGLAESLPLKEHHIPHILGALTEDAP